MAMQKKVTLSLDEDVYKEFQDYCEQNDIQLSKRIERFIRQALDEIGGPKHKKS